MSFPYKHVLLIGATSGIGLAIANRLLENGIQVTAVGRRQERLDAWVRDSGSDKAHGVAFDISQIDAIPEFVKK
jgi:NADP-dependent 3-hydroxy acid dehydrogenase YdfG